MSSVIEAQLQNQHPQHSHINNKPTNTQSIAVLANNTLNSSKMLNSIQQSFDQVKSPPPESHLKIPFKTSLNINRADRLLAKEQREQNMNAVMQDSWKCVCMLPDQIQSLSKKLKIIDHLQKRNCQQCGAFIIGIGSEDDNVVEQQPLTLTVCDYRNGGRSETKIISKSNEQWSANKNELKRGMESSGKKQNRQSTIKIKVLKQKEDHYFADMSPSEIYSYLRLEESSQRFKQTQGRFICLTSSTLKIRKQIVDWIFEMGEKLKQRILTTHLAVVYLDILIQDDKIFEKIKPEILPCACLLLASKFDELDDNIPLIRELQKVCAKQRVIAYDEVIKAEQAILFKLNWDLFKLTPMHFLQNLLGQGIVFSNDKVQILKQKNQFLSDIDEKTIKSVKKHSEFFTDLAIQEYDLQRLFKPSVIAISCIILARKMTKIIPEWNAVGLEELTDYTYEGEIQKCSDKLYKVYQKQFGIVTTKTPNNKISLQQSNGKSEGKQNKHNKENQEKLRSSSGQNRHLGQKGSFQNNQLIVNPVVSKIQYVQKSQVIKEENEPSQISHNTTRSNDSNNFTKGIHQLTLGDLIDPYQLFDQSLDQNDQIQLRTQKPISRQQPQKHTDETKLTLTSSYSSDPQSPSLMTYVSQHTTSDNSKITSQNKNQSSKNQSQVRLQEQNIINANLRKNQFNNQNIQVRGSINIQNSQTQRNLSKNRSQQGLFGLSQNYKNTNQQQINPQSFTSATKLCPSSTKNYQKENQINNEPSNKKTPQVNLLSCRNKNMSSASNNHTSNSRNGNNYNALQLNAIDNTCQTFDSSCQIKVTDIFLSQKTQQQKKNQNLNQPSAPFTNRTNQPKILQNSSKDLLKVQGQLQKDQEVLSSQNTHRYQLSVVPSSQNLTTVNRTTKKSMDFTSKHTKKLDIQPQTTKNSTYAIKHHSTTAIKVYQQQQKQQQYQLNSQENSVTRICTFDTQIAQQQCNNNINQLNNYKPVQSNYEKYLSTEHSKSSINNNNNNNNNKRVFERKKSSVIHRNTTLEEIFENKLDSFGLSPSKQLHNVQTTKNICSSSQISDMQTFAIASQQQNQICNLSSNNYIQRNITYVNKLNKMVKEKKTTNDQINNFLPSHTNSKSTTYIFAQTHLHNDKQKSSTKLYQASTNPYNSTTEIINPEEQQKLKQSQDLIISQQNLPINSNQASQNVSGIMGFNSRRASEFKKYDYLKPTLSSMCRAKSVAPGLKRGATFKNQKEGNINHGTMIQQNITEEQASFDLSCKNKNKSPQRQGPIQVYEKTKSNQKRGNSGIRKPQFRDDQSNERLRLGVFLTNNIEQTQQTPLSHIMPNNSISRQSLGKKQSLNSSNQNLLQNKFLNKSQRNSVSITFTQTQNNSQQQKDSVKSNQSTNRLSQKPQRSTFSQNNCKRPSTSNNNQSQVKQLQNKKVSDNKNISQNLERVTQQSSAANLLSTRSIGGAAIPEEEEHEEIIQSQNSIISQGQEESEENDNQITHQYNFENEEEGDDTMMAENALYYQHDQNSNLGNKSVTHVISSLPDESSQQFDDEEEQVTRPDTQPTQQTNKAKTLFTFNKNPVITCSFESTQIQ